MLTLPKHVALYVPEPVLPVYSVTAHLKFVHDEFGVAPGTDSTVTQMPPSSFDVELIALGLVATLKQPVEAIATIMRIAKVVSSCEPVREALYL